MTPSDTDRFLQLHILCETHFECPVGEAVYHVFFVAHNIKAPGWRLDESHHHDHHELLYTVRGAGQCMVGGEAIRVERGDFCLLPAGVTHTASTPHENVAWESLAVQFDFSLQREPDAYLRDLTSFPVLLPFFRHFLVERRRTLRARGEIQAALDVLAARLALEFGEDNLEFDVILRAQMLELLALMSRAARETAPSLTERDILTHAGSFMRLEKARRFIQVHFAEPVLLRRAAAEACFAPPYFLRRFRETYGITPAQYQINLRMREARRLLIETGLPISSISECLGYSSPEYFARQFRERTGVPPRSYQRQYIEEMRTMEDAPR